MEKHKCKLCFKTFANGRALGGHMRSHMLNLPIPPKQYEEEEEEERPNQLSFGTESSFSPSPSSTPSEEDGDEKGAFYGLRENPKRSIRLVDPEFAFAVDAGSVVLQDRESETESSKNPTRRRSKRTRKLEHQYDHHLTREPENFVVKNKFIKISSNKLSSKTESWTEPEPVSSISDVTAEEDVAFCLMMLSRDKWKRKEKQQQQQVVEEAEYDDDDNDDEDDEEEEEETEDSDEYKSSKNRSSTRGKYKCETCKKVFKSYQALGGHRASHKKIKFYATPSTNHHELLEQENNAGGGGGVGTSSSVNPTAEKRVHECPVCFRVFSSGQALGGHKRTHVTGLVANSNSISTTPVRSSPKFGDNLIDLNLPAPVDDDEASQIELSAVSDAEFVNYIRR